MKAVIQRVSQAAVTVNGKIISKIGRGLAVLLGVTQSDGEQQSRWLAEKTAQLRIFNDEEGKMNLSVKDVGGSVLVVSQFTLYGDARKGNRPSFIKAARPESARQLYNQFVAALRAERVTVKTGRFQAMMQVSLVNDGPVTIILEK